MVVITLTDCPPRLRGDLSLWLFELSAGVYVGHVSTRVRDHLWQRVCQAVKTGRATMVFTAQNEQRMDFRIHQSVWEPIDFDGIKLMLRPSPARVAQRAAPLPRRSDAAGFRRARAVTAVRQARPSVRSYVVIDLETTGLSSMEDEIIELAALRVVDDVIVDSFSSLVCPAEPLSPDITHLTGITQDMLLREGKPLRDVLPGFLRFIGEDTVIAHNAAFDYAFLRCACQDCGLPLLSNRCVDTLALARQKLQSAPGYTLRDLAAYLGLPFESPHRSLHDCRFTKALYDTLNAP